MDSSMENESFVSSSLHSMCEGLSPVGALLTFDPFFHCFVMHKRDVEIYRKALRRVCLGAVLVFCCIILCLLPEAAAKKVGFFFVPCHMGALHVTCEFAEPNVWICSLSS